MKDILLFVLVCLCTLSPLAQQSNKKVIEKYLYRYPEKRPPIKKLELFVYADFTWSFHPYYTKWSSTKGQEYWNSEKGLYYGIWERKSGKLKLNIDPSVALIFVNDYQKEWFVETDKGILYNDQYLMKRFYFF